MSTDYQNSYDYANRALDCLFEYCQKQSLIAKVKLDKNLKPNMLTIGIPEQMEDYVHWGNISNRKQLKADKLWLFGSRESCEPYPDKDETKLYVNFHGEMAYEDCSKILDYLFRFFPGEEDKTIEFFYNNFTEFEGYLLNHLNVPEHTNASFFKIKPYFTNLVNMHLVYQAYTQKDLHQTLNGLNNHIKTSDPHFWAELIKNMSIVYPLEQKEQSRIYFKDFIFHKLGEQPAFLSEVAQKHTYLQPFIEPAKTIFKPSPQERLLFVEFDFQTCCEVYNFIGKTRKDFQNVFFSSMNTFDSMKSLQEELGIAQVNVFGEPHPGILLKLKDTSLLQEMHVQKMLHELFIHIHHQDKSPNNEEKLKSYFENWKLKSILDSKQSKKKIKV